MKSNPRILVLLGTRPEVIKLAPLVLALRRRKTWETTVCLTGQHREMGRSMLAHFGLKPDVEFTIRRKPGSLTALVSLVSAELARRIAEARPDLIVVQGDTTSAMLGALAGFYERIPVAHVEAGLRSFDLKQPYPEEYNRRVISIGADLHFCPTRVSRGHLLNEGVASSRVHVVGNTCIDALFWTLKQPRAPRIFSTGRRGVLVTGHRRENWGRGLEELCGALDDLHRRFPDVEILYPVHPNPLVQETVREKLGGRERIRLVDPMDYGPFCAAMRQAHLIITDSGGVQEEALALGTPTLVTRNVTERPEVLKGGTVCLVGSHRRRIVAAAARLLANPEAHRRARRAHFPFGRGDSAEKIARVIAQYLVKQGMANGKS